MNKILYPDCDLIDEYKNCFFCYRYEICKKAKEQNSKNNSALKDTINKLKDNRELIYERKIAELEEKIEHMDEIIKELIKRINNRY